MIGFPLLSDENIDPAVTAHLRQVGFDVIDLSDAGLRGTTDQQLLDFALREQRVIVTHDSDFGTLAVHQNQPLVGIIHLRPGHIDPAFTIATLEAIRRADPDLQPPFILVARRNTNQVTMRIRRLTP